MNMAAMKSEKSPHKKNISAIFSNFEFATLSLLMERKDRRLLAINITMAKVAISSIIVAARKLSTLIEVSTTKHKPSRFDDVLSI
jgi:hypothetical protein